MDDNISLITSENLTLIQEGNLSVDEQNWERAEELFDRAIIRDYKNAEAYMGKFLCSMKMHSLEAFTEKLIEETKDIKPIIVEADLNYEPAIKAFSERYQIPFIFPADDIYKMFEEGIDKRFPSLKAARQEQYEYLYKSITYNKYILKVRMFAQGEYMEYVENLLNNFFGYLKKRISEAAKEDEVVIRTEIKPKCDEAFKRVGKEAVRLRRDLVEADEPVESIEYEDENIKKKIKKATIFATAGAVAAVAFLIFIRFI